MNEFKKGVKMNEFKKVERCSDISDYNQSNNLKIKHLINEGIGVLNSLKLREKNLAEGVFTSYEIVKLRSIRHYFQRADIVVNLQLNHTRIVKYLSMEYRDIAGHLDLNLLKTPDAVDFEKLNKHYSLYLNNLLVLVTQYIKEGKYSGSSYLFPEWLGKE